MITKKRLLLIVCITFITISFTPDAVNAASCTGQQCNSLNPYSTGCDENKSVLSSYTHQVQDGEGVWRTVYVIYLYRSNTCETKYAETKNFMYNAYINATLKYYYYSYNTSTLPPGEIVTSGMRYNLATGYACGSHNLVTPISGMVYSPCTGGG